MSYRLRITDKVRETTSVENAYKKSNAVLPAIIFIAFFNTLLTSFKIIRFDGKSSETSKSLDFGWFTILFIQ